MRTKQIAYILLILFTLTNCKNDLITKEKILNDIFPQLIDSFHISRTNIYPPPPPPVYDNDSNFIGTDTIAGNLILLENKRILNQIDSVDSRLLLVIIDSCFEIDLEDLQGRTYGEKELIIRILNNNENLKKASRKLNINQIDLGDDYQLMYESELKRKYDNIWRIKDRKFGGIISISKIYFDKEQNYGLLQFDIYPFYSEGSSYYIIIERIDKKWVVKRIYTNWIT